MSQSPAPSLTEEQLICEHMPLVRYIVNEFAARLPGHVERDELISAGNTGLVQAAKSYKSDTGVPFSRWANQRIRGAILDELRGMDWASRSVRRQARDLSEMQQSLTSTLGRAPSRPEVAEALNVGVDELDRMRAMSERVVLNLDISDAPLAATIADDTPTPADYLDLREEMRRLREAIAALPERLRSVVTDVYFGERPMAEIAAELHVTESRVSQLRAEAVNHLRAALAAQESLDNQAVSLPRQRQTPTTEPASRGVSGVPAKAPAVPTQSGTQRKRASFITHTGDQP